MVQAAPPRRPAVPPRDDSTPQESAHAHGLAAEPPALPARAPRSPHAGCPYGPGYYVFVLLFTCFSTEYIMQTLEGKLWDRIHQKGSCKQSFVGREIAGLRIRTLRSEPGAAFQVGTAF